MEKSIDNKKKLKFFGDITIVDWIILAVTAVFCYFTMQQPDIIHTGASSFALLRGHIRDFYEYNAQTLGGNSYMISTYILFALWNIPLALLGLMGPSSMAQSIGIIMWFKGLPTLLTILSGVILFQIFRNYEEKTGFHAKWILYLFLTTSVVFYSQFIFGQYDIFTVFFMLLALKAYLREGKWSLIWFSLLFGIATTFKYHALLFFVPFLFYREKRVFHLIKYFLAFALPIVIINLPYINSSFFSSGVAGFSAVDYFFSAKIDYYSGDYFTIYLVPLLWVCISIYALMKETEIDSYQIIKEIAFLASLVVWLAFGVVFWHPQWLMIAAPYLVISLVVSEKKDILCVIDIAIAYVYLCCVECIWPGMTQGFYGLGVLSDLVANRVELAIPLNRFCLIHDANIAFTSFSCLLLARALILHPKWRWEKSSCTVQMAKVWIKIRGYLGIGILVVPMIICLISQMNSPDILIHTRVDESSGTAVAELNTETRIDDVQCAVWSDPGGEDDLNWYTATWKDNKWICVIDLKKHNTTGMYFVDFYGDFGRGREWLTRREFTCNLSF